MPGDKAYYIILRNGRCVLSRKEYAHWREIQEEYGGEYMTSLEPLTPGELIQYFEEDFKGEANWPFSKKEILDFFSGSETPIYSKGEG